MLAFRKWFYKPKKNDNHLLAQFYYADEDLNSVSHELDSFDGRQDPDRCTVLVNQLRICQDKVLGIIEQLMSEAIPDSRTSRDFRAKFPDDVLQDSLAGQLWFGAECLAAGSTIMNREIESAALRPLARCLTRNLDTLRTILREQSYKNINSCPNKVKVALKKFDNVFAEFELSYVSAMVPVKSSLEYNTVQDVIVLFCETMNRAMSQKLLTQDQIDDYDPGLMFTIPRLAIVSGLVVFSEGPLNMERPSEEISELFRPFQNLLIKIRELLETLTEEELHLLERALCNSEESWEDIERELDQLSFRDRPFGRRDSTLHDEAGCLLSPCSSCITDCETVCSSVLSLTPEDSRNSLHGSVRRKVSDPGNQVCMDDMTYLDIPGAVNCEGKESSDKGRGIRIKRCSCNSLGINSPKMSPDSLDGCSRESVGRRRCSSNRPSDAGLEDSGQFQDASHRSSRSVDSSPRFEKRTSQHCPLVMRERAASDNPSGGFMPSESARELGRVDSGLGSAPNGDLMELYIQEMQAVFEPCEDASEDGESHHEQDGLSLSPSMCSTTNSKEDVGSVEQESNTVIVEMQGSELIVASNDVIKPCKCAKQDPSRITVDFGSNFPIFGKGKPSTELNTVRTVGNSVHGSSSARHSHIQVISRHSDSSILVEPPTDGVQQMHVAVRPSRSEPTFRLPFLGSIGGAPASHLHSGDNIPSALNLVTGSTGIVRQLPSSGSDMDDGSDDLSSSGSSSSCCSSCCLSGHRDGDFRWESDDSSDTNSLISESNDEHEITMAIQAAELAARQQVRSQFRSSSDLVHRLFVCIAGVADQLQTNFASDLRGILKTVFAVTACNPLATEDTVFAPTATTATTTNLASSAQSDQDQLGIATTATTTNAATSNATAHGTNNSNSTTTAVTAGNHTINSSSSPSHDGLATSSAASSSTTSPTTTNNNVATERTGSGHSHKHRAGRGHTVEGSRHGVGTDQEEGGERERRRHRSNSSHRSRRSNYDDPPAWIPDDTRDECIACHSSFTVLRRKHHCRNCGQIFCARCSANSVPLPRFGQMKPVRVCNRCYMFHVTPFQH